MAEPLRTEALPAEALRRPWHGASDRPGDPAVAAIRLQRAEVEALMDCRVAADGSEEQALAWRRMAELRAHRKALMPKTIAAQLPPLPDAPDGALSAWQRLLRRLGLGPR